MSLSHVFNAKSFTEILLSPKEFLNLSETDRENIKSVKIMPAKLGGNGFGKIKVTRKTPVYTIKT